MLPDLDIYRAANELIKHHPDRPNFTPISYYEHTH